MDDLLLKPEDMDKAFEDAFEKPVSFDHKPTQEEIFNLKLKAVAQAQLAHAEPLIRKDERKKWIGILHAHESFALNPDKNILEPAVVIYLNEWQSLKEGK